MTTDPRTLFDEAYYRAANADVLGSGQDPWEHFVDVGWRELRNPSPGFDLWWYWCEHLDPTSEAVNPLLHYAEVGKAKGLSTLPVRRVVAPAHVLPEEPRRICLFAGYDVDGVVDATVVRLVAELSGHAEVHYLADCEMADPELAKLAPFVRSATARRHGRYDFGSWALLASEIVGWSALESYDEVLFVNDSSYLVGSLGPVFETTARERAHWWGLQATLRHFAAIDRDEAAGAIPLSEVIADLCAAQPRYDDHAHVGSYFLAFRRSVIRDAGFRKRIESVALQREHRDLVRRHETGLTRYLLSTGFDLRTFDPMLRPFHPLYGDHVWTAIAEGFPLLKRKFLAANPFRTPGVDVWRSRLADVCSESAIAEINTHLVRVSDPADLARSYSVVLGPNGRPRWDEPWTPEQLAEEREFAPCFQHWWAFPVAEGETDLSSEQRALFDAVADDPSIRKVILEEARHVDAPGVNVLVVPTRSRAGQEALVRCGRVIA